MGAEIDGPTGGREKTTGAAPGLRLDVHRMRRRESKNTMLRDNGSVAPISAHTAVIATEHQGASPDWAKRELGWSPVHPSWRRGFAAVSEGITHQEISTQ